MKKERWYKDQVFYQIWPRSFKDGNGDGIGDLLGIYEKLPYIQSLGVTGIWFSPLYVSPNADYGYDIADYYAISPEYGDLELFRKVLDKAHDLGMKVIMDLVVNHTSDEHPWFLASRDENSPYRDYYFWRKGRKNGKLPNNWDSLFEGKAWEYDEKSDAYYLHIFSIKQADLNMDNPAVRREVLNIMKFWLDMGIDGFREDVITFISKTPGLPNDIIPFASGMRYYKNGPRLREYLLQFRELTDQYDCFTLGEAPMMTPKDALSFVREGDGQTLDLMFHFQHMEADCLFTDYLPLPFNLRRYKRVQTRWQNALRGKAWNTLYLENHDHPRIISRYGSERYREESGKMLACSYLFLQGTPFLYQGQEIGMTNISLPGIDDYADVVAKTNYQRFVKIFSPEKTMSIIRRACRDSARTPVQWDAGEHAGFSESKPWFPVNPNYTEVNVAAQEADPNSLLHFYRAAIALRKELPVVNDGTYTEYYPLSRSLYVYSRTNADARLLVICSFTEKPVRFRAPKGFSLADSELLLHNYGNCSSDRNAFTTRPYETRVYLWR